jgi:hypothetical protein
MDQTPSVPEPTPGIVPPEMPPLNVPPGPDQPPEVEPPPDEPTIPVREPGTYVPTQAA